MDIIMQGGMWPGTISTAEYYLESGTVDRVIISSWGQMENPDPPKEKITFLWNKEPKNPGQGNINMQIVSSLAGLKASTAPACIKTRTDQRIDHLSLISMLASFLPIEEVGLKFFEGSTFPLYHIFVLGLQTKFPFQTQDHIFMGFRRDLVNLFSCPLNKEPIIGYHTKPEWGSHKQMDKGLDFTKHLRMPIWLSGHYFARFQPRVYHFLEHYQDYLCDGAPKADEAFNIYHSLIHDVFKPFPRIKIWWEKYGHDYPYSMYEQQGEINADNWPVELQ